METDSIKAPKPSASSLVRRMHDDLRRTLVFMARLQGLPAPPGKPVLVPGEEDSQPDVVGIRWERSPSNGGSAIIGYHVEHRKMGSPHWVRSAPVLCTYPELTLSGLEPGWRYQFRIRAQNSLGLSEPSELSDPLTVTLQRTASIAPRFDGELRDCVTMEGQQAEFRVAFSGNPTPKISWFKDGFEIFSSRRTNITTDGVLGKSVLVIYRTSIDDEGEIKCSATNRAGHVSTRAKLIIEAPPHVRLPRQYDEGLLFEQGETIRLKATNGGRPPPSITWYHNGEIVTADERHNFESITDNETILKIQDAKRQDRGEYTIRAINRLGEDIASFLVTVTDRPAAPGKVEVVGTLGRSVTLAWKEPEDDGGCKIGTYIVEYNRLVWDMWLKAVTCRQTTVTLNDLIEGSEYRFHVKAENPYGLSDPSEASEIVFIPDPKRGITEPNMRARSASHRDIPRGRSERREIISMTESVRGARTRSLTREEASNREAMAMYERTNSTQRLASGQQTRPSRADSRVTFALGTTNIERGSDSKRQWSKELLPQPGDLEISGRETTSQTAVVISPTVLDDPGGRFQQRPYLGIQPRSVSLTQSRSRSPSPLMLEETTEFAIKEQVENMAGNRTTLSPPVTPRRRRSRSGSVDIQGGLRRSDDNDDMIHGSSEFMLVLYPGEEDGRQHEAQRIEKQSEMARRDRISVTRPTHLPGRSSDRQLITYEAPTPESEEEDLVAPPMSLSLPELFSANHHIVEVFREAVSSTELLHERAMERFYKAVEAEKSAEQLRAAKSHPADLFKPRATVRRRLSNAGASQTTWQLKRDRASTRRSSEASPVTPTLPSVRDNVPSIVLSNPDLSTSHEILLMGQRNTNAFEMMDSGSAERLLRWHEPGMDLSNEEAMLMENEENREKEEKLKMPEFNKMETRKVEEEYDEVAPDTGEILAEDSIETSGVSSEVSSDSEDIKQLKARIMARPVVDEEDTYHPRGRIISSRTDSFDTPPPVPPHRVPVTETMPPVPPERAKSPVSVNISNGSVVQPKSILKKRTETEPVPTNQFGRPIPPEKPLRRSQLGYDEMGRTSADNNGRSFTNLNFTKDISSSENASTPIVKPIPTRPTSPINKSSLSPTTSPIHSPTLQRPASPSFTSMQMRQTSPSPRPASPSFTSMPIRSTSPRPASPSFTSMPISPTSTRPASPSFSSMPERPTSPTITIQPPMRDKEGDSDKEAVISAGEAAVTKRRQMRQGSKTLSTEEEEELQEERMAVVSHYTELVREYSSPEFRQRSMSRDRDQKRYESLSPTETRESSPVRSQPPKEKLPPTPGKIIQPIPPIAPLAKMPAKIIEPIPPVMPTTPIQRAMLIEPSDKHRLRRPNDNHLDSSPISSEYEEPPRGRSRSRRTSESSPPRRSSRPVSSYDERPSRNESPMPRSRNQSKDRLDPRQIRGSTRPSSRSSSKDRSRAGTPSELKMERLQRTLDDKKERRRRRSSAKNEEEVDAEAKKEVTKEEKVVEMKGKLRSNLSYAIDVALLMAAVYVYSFIKELFAIPIVILLLYRYYAQQNIDAWVPEWWKKRRQ